MLESPYIFLMAVLPHAVKALPVLIGVMVAMAGLTFALRVFSPVGAQTDAIEKTAGRVRALVTRGLGFFFLFMLVAINLAAFTAQRDFEAFSAEQRKAQERTR
jgi:uncharacterized membrane protein SpoIIM required for sporulation